MQGKPEEPFIYLSWGVMKGRTFDMFRRAKVRLSHLKPAALRKAAASGKPIEAVVTCTDAQGGPLCASVKDSHITWKV
ncbi:MAG: DUF5990 family protein [Planctomycetota bacterium]|nr:DUF5990 family protein [Planctomycetota bacterium]